MKREDVTSLVEATDAGREGELIFRLVYHKAGCRKPFERLWISSMEDKAIEEGFRNLRPSSEYDALYEAALCRERADWIVGINATRLFSCLYGQTLNVGRVMTPTLAMLAKRQEEIDTFKSEPFYSVRIRGSVIFRNKVKLCGSIMDHIQAFRSASGYLLSALFGTDYYSIRFIDNTGLTFFNYPFCNSRYIVSVNIVIENIVDKFCSGGPGNKSGKSGIKITGVDRVISPLAALYKAADHLLIFQNIENVFNTCSSRRLDTRSVDSDRITVELQRFIC